MKTKLFLLLTLFVTLSQSCTKDKDSTGCGGLKDILNNYNISDIDKSKIPFTGTDTIIFISNSGDTATLIGQGKKISTSQERKNISSNADCPREEINNYEVFDLEYIGSNTELNFIKYKIYGDKDNTKLFYSINDYSGLLTPYYFNTISFYSDSVDIYGVFYIGRFINLLDKVEIIYNYNYGFLKFKFIGKKTWLLKVK